MDLTTMDEDGKPWDLSSAATQRKALRRWEIDKPYLLVASPPCTVFSVFQNLTRDKGEAADVQAELAEAIKFVFKHPVGATSWQLALVKLVHVENAQRVNFDFYQLGIAITVRGKELPVKKRTGVVTNSSSLAKALLQHQCSRLHTHANTMSGRIKQCEVYPDAFCELVCKEVLSERTMDSRDVTAEMNFLMSLECAEQEARAPAATSSRLMSFNGPDKEEDRGIWAK